MKTISLIAVLAISLALTTAATLPEKQSTSDGNFFLHWITYQTKWPLTIEKPLTENSNYDDWYRYDMQGYVSQSPNYKPSYFISKDSEKSELTIFHYNSTSHEQLTTYEPVQTFDYTESTEQQTAEATPEYHTLAYLKSHRIRIDRDMQGIYANVTCIADFLVDQSSLEVYKHLVEDMKNFALFRIDLEEETRGDLQGFRQKAEHKQYYQANLNMEQQIRNQRRQNLLMNPRLMRKVNYNKPNEQTRSRYFSLRNKRDETTTENKVIMNVRLSFGPIFVPQPIKDRMISCNLDLVNEKKMTIDFQNVVYKFLSSRDLGMDKNAEDLLEIDSSNSLNTYLTPHEFFSTEAPTHINSSPKKMSKLTDSELNDIFKKQEIIDNLEQKIIREKGSEIFEAIAKEVIDKSNNSNKPEEEKNEDLVKSLEKAQQRRTFDDLVVNDKLLFILDKPINLDFGSLNSSNSRYFFNYTILVCIAFLNVLFY